MKNISKSLPKNYEKSIFSCCKYVTLLLLLTASHTIYSQCNNSILKAETSDGVVRFSSIIGDQTTTLNNFIRLESQSGGDFAIKMGTLRDERTGALLPSDQMGIASFLSIEKGKTEDLNLNISQISKTGVFTGPIYLTHQTDSCQTKLTVELDVKKADQLSILESDRELKIKYASPSLLNGILPRRIRHEGFNFRVENTGDSPIEIESLTLSLKGNSTEGVITTSDIEWKDEFKSIAPDNITTMNLPLKQNTKLSADEYTGFLRVNLKDGLEPVSLPVTLYSRIGVTGALLVLFLGILVGRMMKDVNKAQDQMEAMDKFIPIRAKVSAIDDEISRKKLKRELDSLEAEINEVKDAAGKEAVEGKLIGISKKVIQINQLQILHTSVADKIKDKDIDQDALTDLGNKFFKVRDEILAGNEEGSKKALQEVQIAVEDLTATRSVGGDAKDAGLGEGIQMEMDKVLDTLKKDKGSGATESTPETTYQKIERWVFKILNFISGVKVTARVRYGIFRPLVSLATFLVIVLLGFQEIYVNGGDTFGAEGIYDYLKLFLWGVVSDVFSRTLVGNDSIQNFVAKK